MSSMNITNNLSRTEPLAHHDSRSSRTTLFAPSQRADRASLEAAASHYESMREAIESALEKDLAPCDRALLEQLSETMEQVWRQLHQDDWDSTDVGGAEGPGESRIGQGEEGLSSFSTELFDRFGRCAAELTDHVESVMTRHEQASPETSGTSSRYRITRQEALEQLREETRLSFDSQKRVLSFLSVVRRFVSEIRASSSVGLAFPRDPLGVMGLTSSSIGVGLSIRDMVVNGVGVQNSADCGFGVAGVAGGLLSGPVGATFAALSAGYSVGQWADETWGWSDSLTGVRGDFMPQDVQTLRRAGTLGRVAAEAMELEARIWDEGYRWYLETTGSHAPVLQTEYSYGRAVHQRASAPFRHLTDPQLIERVSQLPDSLCLAVIRYQGERACGLPGRLPPVPGAGPAPDLLTGESRRPIYHEGIQP